MTLLFQRNWSDCGGLDTAREIAQQPAAWRELAALLNAAHTSLAAFLGSRLDDPRQHVILTGAGSSAYVGQLVADELAMRCAARVRAVPTTSLLTHPERYLAPQAATLLVSFARSGDSPESLAAVDLVRATVSEARFLNITCNPDGRLAQRGAAAPDSYNLLMPGASCDRGFAMTSSFTCMLLAGLCALGDAGLAERLPRLAALGDEALQTWPQRVADLARARHDRVIYLASGPLEGLAREAALKVLELTAGQVTALAETALGFRHGPKSVVTRDTLVVAFRSTHSLARRYEDDLLGELGRDSVAGRCVTVGTDADFGLDAPQWPDVWLAPVWLLMAQSYALLRSANLGLRPDNPFRGGIVNRVVQGVTIYHEHHG